MNEITQLGNEPTIYGKNINFSYGSGSNSTQVLFDNCFEFFSNELIVLTGPSGSGKTTLLTLIGGLRRVQEGHLKVFSDKMETLNAFEMQRMRNAIGFIFQSHNLFNALTARETLELAMKLFNYSHDEIKDYPKKILKDLDLWAQANSLPSNLSGGQRQRVAIARALINKPKLILADEPTASLDAKSAMRVIALLRKMAKEIGSTVIIVTHDQRVMDFADRIVKIVDGRITSNIVIEESLETIKVLQKCNIFEHASAEVLAMAAGNAKKIFFQPGEVIIKEGDIGDAFYIIKKGKVDIYKSVNEGRKKINSLSEGDFFGEIALVKNVRRTASVIAEGEVLCLKLEKDIFKAILDQSNDIAKKLRSVASFGR